MLQSTAFLPQFDADTDRLIPSIERRFYLHHSDSVGHKRFARSQSFTQSQNIESIARKIKRNTEYISRSYHIYPIFDDDNRVTRSSLFPCTRHMHVCCSRRCLQAQRSVGVIAVLFSSLLVSPKCVGAEIRNRSVAELGQFDRKFDRYIAIYRALFLLHSYPIRRPFWHPISVVRLGILYN
jgi:hypothetical protein